MQNRAIRDKCFVNRNMDDDTFVGIKCENGEFSIHFPLGFRISEDDKGLRRDIILLLNTIATTTAKKNSQVYHLSDNYSYTMFPVQAYISIIKDYYDRGYYQEREIQYISSKRGKINWNRTIKTKKPYVQNDNVFYLDFIVAKEQARDNQLISLIHEYCVYDSFQKIGWLFTQYVPPKPKIGFKKKLFKSVLLQKLLETFDDRNKKLFQDMLAIVDYLGNRDANMDYMYGTNRFEYVWEKLIDNVYGIRGKEKFFPKTSWLIGGVKYNNVCLEPDSIMIWNGNIYVLDAKYYKYGDTGETSDLPGSASINKQITYGEYIAEQDKFKKEYGDDYIVYNAFLMPYSVEEKTVENIGTAVSDWKHNDKSYEFVHGLLVDVKHLMQVRTSQDEGEIAKLVTAIEEGEQSGEKYIRW